MKTPKILSCFLAAVSGIFINHSQAIQEGGTSGNAMSCDGTALIASWTDSSGSYYTTTTYNGDCTATVKYFIAGTDTEYQPSQPIHVYGLCDCAPYPSVALNSGSWDHTSVNLANINADTFTVFALTNIDHFTVFNLTNGNAVSTSGTFVGNTNFSLTISNSLFTPGTHYAVSACTADNLIQGSACFQAGAGAVVPLLKFESWQNNSPAVPGAIIVAIDATDHYSSLVQFAGGGVYGGAGTVTNPPALSIATTGSQAVLYWPASATNYFLQNTTNLNSPNWMTVSNGTPVIGVTLPKTLPAAFYRLQKYP